MKYEIKRIKDFYDNDLQSFKEHIVEIMGYFTEEEAVEIWNLNEYHIEIDEFDEVPLSLSRLEIFFTNEEDQDSKDSIIMIDAINQLSKLNK